MKNNLNVLNALSSLGLTLVNGLLGILVVRFITFDFISTESGEISKSAMLETSPNIDALSNAESISFLGALTCVVKLVGIMWS